MRDEHNWDGFEDQAAAADQAGMDAVLEMPNGRLGTGDIFDDLGKLRLGQGFGALGVTKLVTTVQVRKPNKQSFIRVHQNPDFQLDVAAIELKDDHEFYVVSPEMYHVVSTEAVPIRLYAAIDRQGTPFLWPVKLPGDDGRTNSWNESALQAAEVAKRRWIRVAANMSAGCYDVHVAAAELPDPDWPDLTFADLLRIGFRGKVIDTINHSVLRRLRGE